MQNNVLAPICHDPDVTSGLALHNTSNTLDSAVLQYSDGFD